MLRFLGVFGDIAVSANEEETHCAALRRQRSEVRILSGAPIFSMAYPKSYLARFLIGHTVVTRKPLSWLLYAAEMANIRCRSGSAATADRKASTSSTMQSHGRGKKKSWLNNADI